MPMPVLHIGDHSGLSLSQIPWHLLELDHAFFLALSVLIGFVAFRLGRRAEARAHGSRKEKS